MQSKKKQKKEQYIYDLGFIYELGSNMGIYRCAEQNILKDKDTEKKNLLHKLVSECEIYKNQIIEGIKHKNKNSHLKNYTEKEYEDLCSFAFYNGYMQGYDKLKNYLRSINRGVGVKSLYYLQSNLINPLGLHKLNDLEFDYYKKLINIFLKSDITYDEYENEYMLKGQFLKADSIIAILDNSNTLNLLVIDNKADLSFLLNHFKVKNNAGDINALASLLNSKNKKTQFKNSNTDTSSLDFDFSLSLMKYASVSNDKNLLKVIQSGSYAQSFLSYLNELGQRDKFREIKISLMGDTDSDYAIVKLNYSNKNHKNILKQMRKSYERFDRDITQNQKLSIIKNGYTQLLESLSKNEFSNNKKEFDKLLNMNSYGFSKVVIEDYIRDYTPTTDKILNGGLESVRDQHSKLLKEFIEDEEKIICFMAGNPGIGKTYGIKEKLKELDAYYMMYMCPRNALIEDFIQDLYMVVVEGRKLTRDDLIIIGASSTDEKEENGEVMQVVNYDTNNEDNLPKKSKYVYKRRDRNKNHNNNGLNFTYDDATSEIGVKQELNEGVISRVMGASRELLYDADGINKIIAPITIQSLKKTSTIKNTADSFRKTLLKDVVKKNTVKGNYIDPVGFEKFRKSCPYLYIMIDEVTGSSEGAHMYKEVYNIFVKNFYNLLTEEQKSKFTLKIFVADASLPNKEMMLKHLGNVYKIEKEKIYFSTITEKPKKGAYIENVDEQTIVLNANAYPAKDLTSRYHIYTKAHKINNQLDVDAEEERRNINKIKYEIDGKVDFDIVENMIRDIKDKKYKQTIAFIQNKQRISTIVNLLKEEWSKRYGEDLEIDNDYVVLSAELTDAQRIKIIDYINKDSNEKNNKLKFAFITSTASRGISFKNAVSMHIVLQQFGVESFLTELIQAIYRPRGNSEFDNTTSKTLNYYLTNTIFHDNTEESNFEYKKNATLLSILSYITLLKGCVDTRIKGYSKICNSYVSIVPVSGKYITASNSSLLEDIGGYMKVLTGIKLSTINLESKSEAESVNNLIEEIQEQLIKCFSSARIVTSKTIFKNGYTKENVFNKIMSAWKSKDLKELLNLDAFYDYKIMNGMIVFKTNEIYDELRMLKSLEQKRLELLIRLNRLMSSSNLLESSKKATQHIIELLTYELEREISRSVKFKEKENTLNRYIAFPLYSFANYKNIINYDYKKQYSNDKKDIPLNVMEVMKSAIKEYCPSDKFFPIISNYEGEIPFVTFKSDNLESIYNEKFNEDYLLSSTSTNIFNVIVLNK